MTRTFIRALPSLVIMGVSVAASSIAFAAPPRDSTYRQEVDICNRIQQDRQACIREAGAARDAARRGQLTSEPDYRANALARCSLQPPQEQRACEARVTGAGRTEIDGSVLGGGVIRETVTPIPPRPMR